MATSYTKPLIDLILNESKNLKYILVIALTCRVRIHCVNDNASTDNINHSLQKNFFDK